MAISVISSVSAASAAAPGLTGAADAGSPSGGFADLLFSQLGASVSGLLKPATGEIADAKAAGIEIADAKTGGNQEVPLDEDRLATDPTLAFLMAVPVPLAPAMNSGKLQREPSAALPATTAAISTTSAAKTTAKLPPGADVGLAARQAAAMDTTGDAQDAGRAENKAAATTLPPPQTPFAELLGQGGSNADTVAAALAQRATPQARSAATGETGKKTDSSAAALLARSTTTAQETPPVVDEGKAATNVLQNLSAQREATAQPLRNNDSPSLPANIAVESPPPASVQENGLLAAGVAQQAARSEAAAQVKTDVAAPLHSSTWTNEFADKVVWLAKNDQQSAQININPPQLGPIQITLQMNGDQASAVFGSPHAEVRQAIENSLPQLKEMLSSAGINLGQADVGANMAQQNRQAPFQSANGTRLASENAILPGIANAANSTAGPPIQRGRGMVDLFA